MLKHPLRARIRVLRSRHFRSSPPWASTILWRRKVLPYFCYPTSPNHGYATFSSDTDEYEIDLITLRRKSQSDNSDVAPFSTVLDPNGPINGKYDPEVVDKVLRDSTGSEGNNVDANVTPATKEFVDRYHRELNLLDEFIRLSYANTIPDISRLTPVEVSNVLYIFRGLYKKGNLELTDGADLRALDDMVDSFLTLLSEAAPTSRSLSTSVQMLLDQKAKKPFDVDVLSSGIGNFLPELRVLTREYDFNTLGLVMPIVEKISVLVTEFSRFLSVNGAAHNYDADFFKVLIYVLRYKHLKQALLDHSDISPKALLAIAENPSSAEIQDKIKAATGEPQKLIDLISNSSKTILNVIFSNLGFKDADATFAAVSAETEKDIYSEKERHLLESFIETYLPLVCGGVLAIDAFKDSSFSNALVRFDNKTITPYVVLPIFFDNFEFSLASLLGITSRFHVIRAIAPSFNDELAERSLDDLTEAIDKLAEKSSPLILHDAAMVHEALNHFQRHSTRGFSIFDKLLRNQHWVTAWERHNMIAGKSSEDTFEIVDLTNEAEALKEAEPKTVSAEVMQIDGKSLSDFKEELFEFRKHDLRNFNFADISFVNLLRYMNTAIANATSRNESSNGSAITLKNSGSFGQLKELLAANLEPNYSKTKFLDDLVANEYAPKMAYQQIPEELKIHSFVKELEILRNDELKKSFKDSSPKEIVALVDRRCTEFSQGLENLNPTSRMCKANWAVFMKMGGRLKRLFSINGGNTEILDAVINSQSALDKLEAKLAKKKAEVTAQSDVQASENVSKSLYAPGPYVQIPEKLGLHDFVEQLAIFRDELQKPYKDASPTEVLDLMEKRTKEIYNDGNSNPTLRMNKDNMVSFIKLHAKLKKLLAWNGGNTAILDTLIYSQKVFDNFEAKISSKSKESQATEQEQTPYRQIPDDVLLEEFANELEELKVALGSNFGDKTAYQIYKELDRMINNEEDFDKKLILQKLQRNIRMLLKHNGNLTFALDTVLISRKVFDKMDGKLSSKEASNNKFIMSDFLEKNPSRQKKKQLKYNDASEVLALLNNNSTHADVELEKIRAEASIQDALASAMSQEEAYLKEENPEEYAAINSLTAQKIRDSYNKNADTKAASVDKDSLEEFLKSAKKDKESSEAEKFRAEQAYEWSKSMCKSNRTLEGKNFFNPMKSGKGLTHEFLVLTSNGETIYSKENPLGPDHVNEDMVTVLERVSPEVLSKVSKQINKLQRKNWSVIGGGDKDRLVVVSRPVAARGFKVWRILRTLFTTTGMVFVVMLGLHVWLDDVEEGNAPELAYPPSENLAVMEQADVDEFEEQHEIKESHEPGVTAKSLWQRLFWSR